MSLEVNKEIINQLHGAVIIQACLSMDGDLILTCRGGTRHFSVTVSDNDGLLAMSLETWV